MSDNKFAIGMFTGLVIGCAVPPLAYLVHEASQPEVVPWVEGTPTDIKLNAYRTCVSSIEDFLRGQDRIGTISPTVINQYCFERYMNERLTK